MGYHIPLAATLTFALAATFSPGPNNIMSASLGMMHGYRRTLPFMFGVFWGFVVIQLICAAAAALLLQSLPAVEPALRYVGAAYILWLAWTMWSKRDGFGQTVGDDVPRSQGFVSGFGLQFANPKGAVYGLMMYSTFLAGVNGQILPLTVCALVLSGLAFASTSLWALAGTTIRRWLRTDRDRIIAAAVLAVALVYTAVELADLPALVHLFVR